MNEEAEASERAWIEDIRSRFPALLRRHEGLPVAYFDGPGGTQVPRPVVAAMENYLYHHNANTHWSYPTSAETDESIDAARRAVGDFVNGDPDEIVFGANMTTMTLHLARALCRGLAPGDELVVTELDHHANVDPWRDAARERGLIVRTVAMDPRSGTLDRSSLEKAIGPRTRLVAVGAASNALGSVNDLRHIAGLAKRHGALFFVDAVHSAPHFLPDVRAIGCDFLACSAYKFYGPHVGILWGRRELIESLDAPRLLPAPDSSPERLETGTQNHEGIVGAAAAVDFLASIAGAPASSRRAALLRVYERLEARGRRLFERMWIGLSSIPGVRLFGPGPREPRTPTVSFVVHDTISEDVAIALARRGLFASHGDFYAATAIARLGFEREGVVRAGCALYTTEDEIDRLVEAVREIALGRGESGSAGSAGFAGDAAGFFARGRPP